jgi:predicted AlkP superfamily pyrophosphatase or phosphodiesterase
MREIDSKISELVTEAESNNEKLDIFIFSDHGMVDIVNNVNIKEHLENSELKKVDDYIAFYDSTMARFWVEDEKVKKRIIEIVSSIDHVTYLDEELRNKYKINFKTRKW